MGSGKTTLGKKLAKKLNCLFFDLDLEIEKRESLTIAQIFEQFGEDHFRTIEKQVLNELICNEDKFILSLGGGTPCFFDNIKVINDSGTSIYLKYNAGILASRLISAKAKRPLIKDLNEAELKMFIADKLTEREPFYEQSTFILEQNNLKVEDLIELL